MTRAIALPMTARLASGQPYPQKGTWNLTDPQVDQTTDSLIMRATIPNPDRTLSDFARSPEFTPGITYRVLRAGDGKVGMYQLLKAGGRLDSEFFPESIGRHSFPSAADYSTFLRKRQVDTVIIFDNYDVRWRTNEHALLEQLASDGTCSAGQVGVDLMERLQRFDVYRIQRMC